MLLYTEPDIAPPLALKQLLGRERVQAFGDKHPLAPGFRAIDKRLRGNALSALEIQCLGELQLLAEVVNKHLKGRGHDYVLRGDLCNTDRCRALWFEALVVRLVIERNVGEVEWRRYQEGMSDIHTRDPEVQVECKLVEAPSVVRILDRVTDRIDQRQPGDGPFILVGGTDQPMEDEAIDAASSHIGAERDAWFGRHPAVSAVLILMPRSSPAEWREDRFGLSGMRFNELSALWLRNNRATERIPEHFDLRPRG